jgi:aspartate racemase
MKTAGIIGGLGPETTSKFYLEIIFSCQKLNKSNRPPIIISSVPLPYALEKDAIVNNSNLQKLLPYLIAEAKRLEKSGADFIVMPCNSLHLFIDDIRESVNIPVLSIIEKTAEFLKKKNFNNIGIVSTAITAQNKLYEKELSRKNMLYSSPNEDDQVKLNQIVYKLVVGEKDELMRKELLDIMNKLDKSDCAVLACTDLQLLKPVLQDIDVFDTMKILADTTVEEILKQKFLKLL